MAATPKNTIPSAYSTARGLEEYASRVRIVEEKRSGFDDLLAHAREQEARLRYEVASWFEDWASSCVAGA